MRLSPVVPALALLGGAVSVPVAVAQERIVEEPTTGLSLPAVALAGDHDANAVVTNPAGVGFLDGFHMQLALTALDPERASTSGTGIGLYMASAIDMPFLPRLAFGLGFEKLFPPADALDPDVGEPARFTYSQAFGGGGPASLGFAWHHFFGVGDIDGTDTFDLGIALRLGNRFALGSVVRDLTSPTVGVVPVQRRYLNELVIRPLGSDRLELGLGVEIGERRTEVDPRFRFGWRVTDGLALRGDVTWLTRFVESPTGVDERRDWLASLGLELSFGQLGAGAFATGGRIDGEDRVLGGSMILRVSSERYRSVLGPGRYVARLELEDLGERTLTRIVTRLRRLERDPSLVGVIVICRGVEGGWASVEEVRDGLQRLKKQGRKVYAYVGAGTLKDYYVAAIADEVWLDPAGGLRIQGVSTTVLFFKNLLDQLGVLAQFEKIEEWKSAPEAYTRDSSSPEAKQMRTWLIDGLYARLVDDIANDRKLTREQVRKLIEGGPYTAADAKEAGLVDDLKEPTEVDALLAKKLGGFFPVRDEPARERAEMWTRPQIAVIYVDGDIVDGKSKSVPILGQKLVGGDTIAESIAWARANPRVEAIVLRVDSPGGSALASEVMSREVFQTRGKKPIIVSMGDIAASGGYFCSAGADRIFALPLTITGSIGIFTGKVDASTLLKRVGVTWETTTRGSHADMEGFFRPYTDEERALIKKKLRYYYERFTGAVARGRKMTMEEVDKVGRGAVWTGEQARERNLVDQYGGLGDALGEAKRRAGLRDEELVELVLLPRDTSSIFESLIKLAGGKVEADDGATGLPTFDSLRRLLPASILAQPDAIQARLPFVLTFE
jgi:protease-4